MILLFPQYCRVKATERTYILIISKKTYINIGDRHVIIARSRKNLMSLCENSSQKNLDYDGTTRDWFY